MEAASSKRAIPPYYQKKLETPMNASASEVKEMELKESSAISNGGTCVSYIDNYSVN